MHPTAFTGSAKACGTAISVLLSRTAEDPAQGSVTPAGRRTIVQTLGGGTNRYAGQVLMQQHIELSLLDPLNHANYFSEIRDVPLARAMFLVNNWLGVHAWRLHDANNAALASLDELYRSRVPVLTRWWMCSSLRKVLGARVDLALLPVGLSGA